MAGRTTSRGKGQRREKAAGRTVNLPIVLMLLFDKAREIPELLGVESLSSAEIRLLEEQTQFACRVFAFGILVGSRIWRWHNSRHLFEW